MNWRRLNRVLHRDLGYVAIGLTLLYAVTGILLNHIHDVNPRYSIEGNASALGKILETDDGAITREVLSRLGITEKPISTFRPDSERLDIFFEGGGRVSVDLRTGGTVMEKLKRRALIGSMNDLHLNRPRAPWTWIADVYAVVLGFLAVTGGLFAVRNGGISKRGAALMVSGFLLAGLSLLFTR